MKTAATLILSVAALVLLIALGSGCSKATDPNDPNNKKNAMSMKPSASGGVAPGVSGSDPNAAKAGPKE